VLHCVADEMFLRGMSDARPVVETRCRSVGAAGCCGGAVGGGCSLGSEGTSHEFKQFFRAGAATPILGRWFGELNLRPALRATSESVGGGASRA
jgi:hypothetical protein